MKISFDLCSTRIEWSVLWKSFFFIPPQLKCFFCHLPGPHAQWGQSYFGEKNLIRAYAMQLLLALNKLARASRRWVITNSTSKVLLGKWLVLASLSSVLLQIVSGLLRYKYKSSSHQILACNKGLLCYFDTTVLPYSSYNCNLHLLHTFLCCWCTVKPAWCE